MTAPRGTTEQIVRDLAASDPQHLDGDCRNCGEYLGWDDPKLNVHADACVWQRAVEWVASDAGGDSGTVQHHP